MLKCINATVDLVLLAIGMSSMRLLRYDYHRWREIEISKKNTITKPCNIKALPPFMVLISINYTALVESLVFSIKLYS